MDKVDFEILKELEQVLNIVSKLTLLNQIDYFNNLKFLLKSHNINHLKLPLEISTDELLLYTACSILALKLTLE